MKKVYFAGSIRGGRVDADLYKRMIEHMQKTAIVITEHVGSPHLNIMEQGKRDQDIYDQDYSIKSAQQIPAQPHINDP